jgi:hypothetical protein
MHRTWLRIILVILFMIELANVYLIMPFPGSQLQNTVAIAYWLHNNIGWIRLLLLVSGILLAAQVFKSASKKTRIKTALPFIFYMLLFFIVKYEMKADTMFYEPKNLVMAPIGSNKVSGDKLVIGVTVDGNAKAYPIQYIGYHHQVRDSIDKTQIMVTYCTVCRTGRVFSPVVDGKVQRFRLVGMDHFNAMFEDGTTKSWWRQANGEAIAGPLKGKKLLEIPSQQMLLSDWLLEYPNSQVMQPDSLFAPEYSDMQNYDKGLGKSDLTKRDSLSWKGKSWVLGISIGEYSRAYDWNDLVTNRIINDSFGTVPVVLLLEKDSASFHGWSRRIAGRSLDFIVSDSAELLIDRQTRSTWNMGGWCIEGPLKGNHLARVPTYQEFWHSWQTFHPATSRYTGAKN